MARRVETEAEEKVPLQQIAYEIDDIRVDDNGFQVRLTHDAWPDGDVARVTVEWSFDGVTFVSACAFTAAKPSGGYTALAGYTLPAWSGVTKNWPKRAVLDKAGQITRDRDGNQIMETVRPQKLRVRIEPLKTFGGKTIIEAR